MTSLSVKTRRFSNIFSKISTEPSDCVASATRDRREVGRERGPRAVLDLGLVAAGVARDDELLAARDDDVVAVELGAQAEALEDEPDHPQVVGARSP